MSKSKPVILVVDDDPQVRAAVKRDMRSRYDRDYQIMAADSGEEAWATVSELKARGSEMAMILSDQRMPGMQGVELLTMAREIYPRSRRVLLTAYADVDAAVKALNEAQSHYYLYKPWHPPEERLYPVVDDLLDVWQVERPAEPTGLRVVGHQWSPRSHAIKDFLAANLIPYRWLDADRDTHAAEEMAAAFAGEADLPLVVLESGVVVRNPTVREMAERLNLRVSASRDVYDVAIVGAGPAGLAAAVYGASEGLKTVLLDRHGPGGQAGTSSRIENYLGFPAGVSGSELTHRAITQARRLGAEFIAPVEVKAVKLLGGLKVLQVEGGDEVFTKTIVVATGMTYREHPATGLAELTGAGAYYGAAATEAQACRGGRVMVIGGGNSAGQAAMYLAGLATEVHLVIRKETLSGTMSNYLIEQIARTPNIKVRPFTEVEAVEGAGRLERVVMRCANSSDVTTEDMDALFVFIGTRPHTDWLPDEVLRDAKGFVVTGRDTAIREGFARVWKEERQPLTLETTVPGIFAAGDVRAGAMNRVAAAVGEGSMVVRLVHEYLALT
jgi:thioredoxin reductase (NADPH)